MGEKRISLRYTLFDQYQVYIINWDYVDRSLSINKRNFLFVRNIYIEISYIFSNAHGMTQSHIT